LVGIEPVGIGVGLLVTWGLGVGAGFAVRRVRIQQPPWLEGIGGRESYSESSHLGYAPAMSTFANSWRDR
jgi:hypothetical protein